MDGDGGWCRFLSCQNNEALAGWSGQKKIVRSFTWDDCIAEYNLDLEISHIFQVNEKNVKKKIFFACIGLFEERFTVWDQL